MNKNENTKVIKDAQFRKSLSIAFFNATNSAIEMCKATGDVSVENLTKWREFFLAEHAEYYSITIQSVGEVFDVSKTIDRIKNSKTVEELRAIYFNISQNERDNPEIFQASIDKKKELSTPKRKTTKETKNKKEV